MGLTQNLATLSLPFNSALRKQSLSTIPVQSAIVEQPVYAFTKMEVLHEDVYGIFGMGPGIKTVCGFCTGIPGAHTQGKSLDELQRNLKEVLEYVLKNTEMLVRISHGSSDSSKSR